MSIPSGLRYNPDEDFRLLFDEVGKKYYIQKKRLIFGWKFLMGEYRDIDYAKERLRKLRAENRKCRVKKRFVVLDY